MSTKTSKNKPNTMQRKQLERLAQECADIVINFRGPHHMPPLMMSATNKLLIKKGILTIDELRQEFVDQVEKFSPEIVASARILTESNQTPASRKKSKK